MKSVIKGFFLVVFAAMTADVKSQVKVDPGVSANNYKHPNKAKKAKADQNSVEVLTLSEVKQQDAASQEHRTRTPKYAKRHTTLVKTVESEEKGQEFNPAKSSRNYKAGHTKVSSN